MAYTDFYEVRVSGLNLSTTGDKSQYSFGTMPHIIRRIGIVCKTDPTGSGVVAIDRRPTAGSDTGRVNNVHVLNIPSSANQGNVVYLDELNSRWNPGEELVIEVTTAVAGLTSADVILLVEPTSEVPVNITSMIKST